MSDESEKLDELEKLQEKIIELTKYFVIKNMTKELSDIDNNRYKEISNKFSTNLFEFLMNMNISKEEMSIGLNYELNKAEDNIKNS